MFRCHRITQILTLLSVFFTTEMSKNETPCAIYILFLHSEKVSFFKLQGKAIEEQWLTDWSVRH